MKSFNVIINDFNAGTFKPYDIMPYLVREYNESKNKPSTFEEFRSFVKREARHQWWARCEYEIMLSDWPGQKHHAKWDIYKQVMMNLDIVTTILMENASI